MKRKRDSKQGWILYLMVHCPLFFFVKIGITGVSATKRAQAIDEAVWGFPIPIFVVFIPGAYFVEQWLHDICHFLKVDFYKGDGHSEWFLFPAILPALAVQLFFWGVYAWIVSKTTNFDALSWYFDFLLVLLKWAVSLVR